MNTPINFLEEASKLGISRQSVSHVNLQRPKAAVQRPQKSGSTTLAKYTGEWTDSESAHLLRRTISGPTLAEIKQTTVDGMDATIATLLRDTEMPDPPINYTYPEDVLVPLGETWVNTHYDLLTRQQQLTMRRRSMEAWTMKQMLEHKMSIREKLVLFWHNHFVVGNFSDPLTTYQYSNLLRTHALGSFKQLAKDITIDPAMLRYLNGNQNRNGAPNENYARELLELFTVGKGDAVGEGDYSTFTEDDVREVARALTGWVLRGFNSTDPTIKPTAEYIASRHDKEDKQLSKRFNNAVITDSDIDEYKVLIDTIFESPYVATYLARELYLWFVYYDITPEVTENIIEPLAEIIREDDYNIKRAVETLLSSEHFYESTYRGAMIKNPIDYIVSLVNQFEFEFPTTDYQDWGLYQGIFNYASNIQMRYYEPPNVSGWKAWYQEPVFYQVWINSATLAPREFAISLLSVVGVLYDDGSFFGTDVFKLLESTSQPDDIHTVIREFSLLLTPRPLTEGQIRYYRELLLGNADLPDFEWTDEYYLWKNDPETYGPSFERKLKAFVSGYATNEPGEPFSYTNTGLLFSPEYYLS